MIYNVLVQSPPGFMGRHITEIQYKSVCQQLLLALSRTERSTKMLIVYSQNLGHLLSICCFFVHCQLVQDIIVNNMSKHDKHRKNLTLSIYHRNCINMYMYVLIDLNHEKKSNCLGNQVPRLLNKILFKISLSDLNHISQVIVDQFVCNHIAK